MDDAEETRALGREEWRRHWPYVLNGVVGTTFAACSFVTLGTVMKPLLKDTGWNRTDVVGVTLIVAFLSLVIAPLYGRLLDRFGPRRVALTGCVLTPIALASAGLANHSIWSWWVAWFFIVLSSTLISVMTWSHAIARRFVVRRGLAMGITLTGMGLASFVVPPLGVFLLTRFGWRGVYFGLGAVALVTLLPLTYFVFHDLPVATESDLNAAPVKPLTGYTAREVFATFRYWRLALAVIIVAATAGFINVHLQPILLEAGMTAMTAASIAVFYGPAQIGARLLGGHLLDRLPGPIVVVPLFLAPLVSLYLLSRGLTMWPIVVAIPFMTGIAAGVEMDVAAYFVSRHFGTRSYGVLFAVIFALHSFGYAISPAVAAYVRDHTGGYQPIFTGLMILIPFAALLAGTLGRYPASLPFASAAPVSVPPVANTTNAEVVV